MQRPTSTKNMNQSQTTSKARLNFLLTTNSAHHLLEPPTTSTESCTTKKKKATNLNYEPSVARERVVEEALRIWGQQKLLKDS